MVSKRFQALLDMLEEELNAKEDWYRSFDKARYPGSESDRMFRFGELRGQMDGFESALFMVKRFFENYDLNSKKFC